MVDNDNDGKEGVDNRPYEVGYRKPPVEHRFKLGKSGNPKGRPKGSGTLSYKLHKTFSKVMDTKMESTINGNATQLTVLETLTWWAVTSAMKGKSPRLLEFLMARTLKQDDNEAERKHREQERKAPEKAVPNYKIRIEFVDPKPPPIDTPYKVISPKDKDS